MARTPTEADSHTAEDLVQLVSIQAAFQVAWVALQMHLQLVTSGASNLCNIQDGSKNTCMCFQGILARM
jgi:hypothetical protein